MSAKPWMKWYPSDWRAETKLKMVSRAARSLWQDMLGLMHEAVPYGHLIVGGVPPTARQLASILGDTEKDVKRWLQELEQVQVFSCTEDGVIFSRRMVRDREKENSDRLNGKAGGNPKLKGQDEGGVKGGNKAQKPETRDQIPEKEKPSAAAPLPREVEQGLLLQICSKLGVDLRADTSRINWPAQLNSLIREGLKPEHLLASAEQVPKATARTLRSLSYLAPRAKELQAAAALPAPLQAFEPADTRGWSDRCRVWFGIVDDWDLKPVGAWVRKWGPKPGEEGCHCPPEILAAVATEAATLRQAPVLAATK